jgi:hypothetical protein
MYLIKCYILRTKNYMFRPVVAIIRFYHSTHLRLFHTIRVAACLMRRSLILSESNNKNLMMATTGRKMYFFDLRI